MIRKITIAIDGLSGCGKSTTARAVAHILGYIHIDSGAMYRSVTLYLLEQKIPLTDSKRVADALTGVAIRFGANPTTGAMEVYMNGRNVEHEIRTVEIAKRVSQVSVLQEVRATLVGMQRSLGKGGGVVMDGRDIGTTVFPQAALKLFMTADLDVRGRRRQRELSREKSPVSFDDIVANLKRRDTQDSTRAISPLRPAEDAIILDTTYRTLDEQVDEVVRLALSKMIVKN